MKQCSKTMEHGTSLLTALFAITLLSLVTGLTTALLYEQSIVTRHTTHALEQSLHAPQELLSALMRNPLPTTRTSCVTTAASPSRAVNLCTTQQLHPRLPLPPRIDGRDLQNRALFPLFDLARVFHRQDPCVTHARTPGTTTRSGFRITPSAVVSLRVCAPQSLTSLVTTGNIETDAAFDITGTSLITIAAHGYIDAPHEIHVSAPALIIAGGDIHLASLIQSGPAPRRATLVALTGSIVVDQIQGDLKLRAIAWQGVYLPGNATLDASAPMPPLRLQEVDGFRF